jgi:DAACS family dicarboxylate/amino acid:cation (Na+ or H+) symporter
VPRNPVQAMAGMDMLGVIFFALVFGAALTLIPAERAQPMVRLLQALGDVVIKFIDFAMKLAPYGVAGLIFVETSRFGWDLLGQLGWYVALVVGGLLIHAAVTLSVLVRVAGGLQPWVFWKKSRASVITAFSTPSPMPPRSVGRSRRCSRRRGVILACLQLTGALPRRSLFVRPTVQDSLRES